MKNKSEKAAKPAIQLQCFATELSLLLMTYNDEPANIPHLQLAEALGTALAEQCLRDYGYRGFQYADEGVRAILRALREMRTPRLLPAQASAQEHF